MKYLKTYNESLKDVLKGKSDNDILDKIKNLSTDEIIKQSIKNNFKAGLKYVLDERKKELTEDEIYILEKYALDLHQDEERPYETWFKEQLSGLDSFISKNYKEVTIYKKDNDVLFNYNIKNNGFYIDYSKIWSVLEKNYKLKYNIIKLLTKGVVEEHLKLKDITTWMGFETTTAMKNTSN